MCICSYCAPSPPHKSHLCRFRAAQAENYCCAQAELAPRKREREEENCRARLGAQRLRSRADALPGLPYYRILTSDLRIVYLALSNWRCSWFVGSTHRSVTRNLPKKTPGNLLTLFSMREADPGLTKTTMTLINFDIWSKKWLVLAYKWVRIPWNDFQHCSIILSSRRTNRACAKNALLKWNSAEFTVDSCSWEPLYFKWVMPLLLTLSVSGEELWLHHSQEEGSASALQRYASCTFAFCALRPLTVFLWRWVGGRWKLHSLLEK